MQNLASAQQVDKPVSNSEEHASEMSGNSHSTQRCPPNPMECEQLGVRMALIPVTHDIGIQVTLQPSRTDQLASARGKNMGTVAMMAMQHARELAGVHRELMTRTGSDVPPTDLTMERRPERTVGGELGHGNHQAMRAPPANASLDARLADATNV